MNTSTFVGLQIGGTAGALAATAGCILCGVVISLTLYKFFQTHRKSAYVMEVLNGLKSASLGLIISAACTIVLSVIYGNHGPAAGLLTFNRTAVFLVLALLFLLRRWKMNPVVIMVISGMAGYVCYL